MIRKISILLAFTLFIGSVYAESIDKSKALQIAKEFLKNKSLSNNLRVVGTSEDMPNLKTKGATSSVPNFYFITGENSKGFVIVSADDVAMPVLGYSLNEEIDIDNLPEPAEAWLSFLRKQIIDARAAQQNDSYIETQWEDIATAGEVVTYLETASWSQGYPYYNQCPTKNSEHCVTGCVATALGEVMRYHKWPKSGTGTTTAYTCSGNISVASRNLNHEYDWDIMPLTKLSSASTQSKDAVACLLADIGAAINSTYSLDGTSAFAANASLIDNFGYNSSTYVEYRTRYQDNVWIKMLKAELDASRPIIYNGFSENSTSGHCFVLDGYDSQNYMHTNWGWGGSANGWYLITAMNPEQYSFNTNQIALFDFKPEDGNSEQQVTEISLYAPGLVCSSTTFEKNKAFKIDQLTVCVTSMRKFDGTVYFYLVDKEGNLIEELVSSSISISPGTRMQTSNISVTITKDIKPGYRIRVFCKKDGSNTIYPLWNEYNSSSLTQEILVAADIEESLEEGTSFYYDRTNNVIYLLTLSDAELTIYNKSGEPVSDCIEKNGNTFTINLSELSEDKYTALLKKGSDTKSLVFSVKHTYNENE